MQLTKIQAHDILKAIHCDDDYAKSGCGNSVKRVIRNSKQEIASKIKLSYWVCGRLKRGSLFTLVNDRLASKRVLYRRK